MLRWLAEFIDFVFCIWILLRHYQRIYISDNYIRHFIFISRPRSCLQFDLEFGSARFGSSLVCSLFIFWITHPKTNKRPQQPTTSTGFSAKLMQLSNYINSFLNANQNQTNTRIKCANHMFRVIIEITKPQLQITIGVCVACDIASGWDLIEQVCKLCIFDMNPLIDYE